MELRQLRYFVAVAEECHFGRAAKRLYLTQPTLSTQIKSLEEELAIKLFERSTRQVVLTDAGRAFLDKARETLSTVEVAKEAARGAEQGLRGQLAVGFISSATLSLLPPAIRLFRKRFSGVDLELKGLTSAEQLEALYEGRIQVGFVRLPLRAPGLRLEPVLEEPLIVAIPSGHPLEAFERVPLQALKDLPLVFFSSRLVPGFHAQLVELFERMRVLPKIVQYAVHVETVIGLVASGIGLSILPASAERIQREGTVYRPLDVDATTWLGLAWLAENNSILIENFLRIVREVAEDKEVHNH